MDVDVRPCVTTDELADGIAVIGQYFGLERSIENAERFLHWIELDRMHGAWDGDRIVGGAGAFTFDVSVPGGNRLPCAGVSVIGVQPTGRRRGVMAAMMRAQLDDITAAANRWPTCGPRRERSTGDSVTVSRHSRRRSLCRRNEPHSRSRSNRAAG
jgi:GNAT superfamily N-acetyltransferase